jgi:hypothetical protein
VPRSLFLGEYAPRRFPPPWSVEELEACFVVRDHNGHQRAYVYFRERLKEKPAVGGGGEE